jgi:hypothetical protein
MGAVAEADVPASPTTAVVELVDLMRPDPPGLLADFVGRRVTVDLSRGDLAAGEMAIFFTRLWQLGEGLALVELDRRPVGATAAAGDRVRADLAAADDQRLAQRLEAAEMVVVGKVVGMRAAAAGPSTGPVTEHDPQWMEAVVEVERRLKGPATAAASSQVVVRFPGSRDVAWRYAPRLEIGQEGLFLLADSGLVSATAGGPDAERWQMDETGQVLDAGEAERAARLLAGQ